MRIRQTSSKQFVYVDNFLIDLNEVVAWIKPTFIDNMGIGGLFCEFGFSVKQDSSSRKIGRRLILNEEYTYLDHYPYYDLKLNMFGQPVWEFQENQLFDSLVNQWMEIKNVRQD